MLYLSKAIFYLEETFRNSEKPERDTLVNLACMYGCAGRYDEMIRISEQSIKADEDAKDDLQESKRLSLLMLSCGIEKRKIESSRLSPWDHDYVLRCTGNLRESIIFQTTSLPSRV